MCRWMARKSKPIILAEGVSNQAPDHERLIPMLGRVEKNTGRLPGCLTADAGYMSEGGAAHCEEHHINPYISPSKQRHRQQDGEPVPEHESQA